MLRQFWEKQSHSSSYPSSIICLLVVGHISIKDQHPEVVKVPTPANLILYRSVNLCCSWSCLLSNCVHYLTDLCQSNCDDRLACVFPQSTIWPTVVTGAPLVYRQPAITATTGGSRSCADSASAGWWWRVKLTIQQLWSVWWDPAPVSQCRHIQLDRRLSEREGLTPDPVRTQWKHSQFTTSTICTF